MRNIRGGQGLLFLFSAFWRCGLDFTGNARLHIAHQVVKRFLFQAGRTQVGASPADDFFRIRKSAPELAGRTDIKAASAKPANLRADVEGRSDASTRPASAKSDGLGHHLFFTHPHTQTAEDAVFVFLPEPLLSLHKLRPGPGSSWTAGRRPVEVRGSFCVPVSPARIPCGL
jgi:hypothetical protein